MLLELLLTTTVGGAVALPLDTDHLLSQPGNAKVILVIDESCSMEEDFIGQPCPAMVGNILTDGGTDGVIDSRSDQVRAALTGCLGNEGILDLWAGTVEFAVTGFGAKGDRLRVIHDFSNDKDSLEYAINGGDPDACQGSRDYVPGLRHCGGTPMVPALDEAGQYLQDWWSASRFLSEAEVCDRHHLVLLSDGIPTRGDAFLDFACGGDTLSVGTTEPWLVSEYMHVNGDMLCDLPEEQTFTTYSVGFGTGGFDPVLLTEVADKGGGFYEYAADSTQLGRVFDRILQDIVSKEAVTFGPGSISNNGLFSGNFAYVSMFRPRSDGAWVGNLKKACILPDRTSTGQYDTSELSCLFMSSDGTNLLTNPNARDQWSLAAGLSGGTAILQNAVVGGAGRQLLATKFGDVAPNAPVSIANPWARRDLKTWVPGGTDYAQIDPASLSEEDAGVGGCARYKLMAFLHGYDPETFDCTALHPINMSAWPMGAVVNSGTALLAYDKDCETAGNCTVVTGTNNGQIHFFDAATGREHSAIVPGDLWKMGYVTQRPLIEVLNQPNVEFKRLPVVDGGLVLVHFDWNGNAIIDDSDAAWIVFGLGHGGSAYYFIDVSNRTTVIDGSTPVYPIVRTPGHWTENLRSTSAAPVVGIGKFPGSLNEQPFVAFTSGGIWEAADPLYDFHYFPGEFDTNPAASSTVACTQLTSAIGAAGNYICDANVVGAPLVPSYDASALTTVLGGGSLFNAPYTVVANGTKQITGMTLEFVDLEPNDELLILDTEDGVLARVTQADNGSNVHKKFLTSNHTGSGDAVFKVRMNTDGVAGTGKGIRIESFDVLKKPHASGHHRPFMAVIDPFLVNGSPSPRPFASETVNGAELLVVTNDCTGYGLSSKCIDKDSPGASDLKYMRCPISAPPAVYSEGGVVEAFYVGDWCGQIFRIRFDPTSFLPRYVVKRILHVNEQFDPSAPDPNVVSRQLRKFERRLDVFATGCSGERAVGISFGTGSMNRPGAIDDLVTPSFAPAVTNYHLGRDVAGTIFDKWFDETLRLNVDSDPDSNCSGDCLTDVTSIPKANENAPGYRGFFFALHDDERMLRDSLTIDGVTFYPTYQVTTAASTCQAGLGADRVYAVNNCTAEPAPNGGSTGVPMDDRVVEENPDGSVGGDLFVVTPEDGAPIVTSGNMNTRRPANLLQSTATRGFRILFWYQPTEI